MSTTQDFGAKKPSPGWAEALDRLRKGQYFSVIGVWKGQSPPAITRHFMFSERIDERRAQVFEIYVHEPEKLMLSGESRGNLIVFDLDDLEQLLSITHES